nr:MAG TPA: hypothetical protein [Caudoviricetes sp.]
MNCNNVSGNANDNNGSREVSDTVISFLSQKSDWLEFLPCLKRQNTQTDIGMASNYM